MLVIQRIFIPLLLAVATLCAAMLAVQPLRALAEDVLAPVQAASAPGALPEEAKPAPCSFQGGFLALRRTLGPELTGECVEDEHPISLDNPAGTGTGQRTTKGLFVWRQADNWTVFTDGSATWINRPDGVWRRLNGERYPWEAGAATSGLPLRYPSEVAVPETPQHPPYTVYLPDRPLAPGEVFDAVLVLHGIGVDGPTMAAASLSRARQRGLAVVAPTIAYGDWRNPTTIRDEELRFPPSLGSLLTSVGTEAQVPVTRRVLVFGFSRGAQAASRLAMFRPDLVRAVAAFDAGTYTLPVNAIRAPNGQPLAAPLPYGVADLEERTGRPLDLLGLRSIPWLVGAGLRDNNPDDVPRQWDLYIGSNRVERAQRFAGALVQTGVPALVALLPDSGHEMTGPMLDQVFSFFDHAPAA